MDPRTKCPGGGENRKWTTSYLQSSARRNGSTRTNIKKRWGATARKNIAKIIPKKTPQNPKIGAKTTLIKAPPQPRNGAKITLKPSRSGNKEIAELNLSLPFVAVDSEGQSYDGDDVIENGVPYKAHGTYLWCASAAQRTGAVAGETRDYPPQILLDPRTNGDDKRVLDAETILDWLLSLPSKYGEVRRRGKDKPAATFIMFGMSYDVSEILAQTKLKTAYQIFKHKRYDDDEAIIAPVFWKGYAISYFRGKWLDIWRLRDPDNPYKTQFGIPITKKDGSLILDTTDHIKIYEAFGYFQRGFAKVVDDMLERGMATAEEAELIGEMKKARGTFEKYDIERIREYCLAECRLLATQMTELRQLLYEFGLRPPAWHGPGAVASELIKQRGIAAHFGENIAADNLSPQQEWSHVAYVGGRTELLKQGYLASGSLSVYDVSSCYPSALVRLPTLAPWAGRWVYRDITALQYKSMSELRALVEAASPVSIYHVRWKFQTCEKRFRASSHLTGIDKERREGANSTFIPFFPLPYRTKTGGIVFPAKGESYAMQDDMLAAIAWMEKFVPEYPRKKIYEREEVYFEIKGAWVWEIALNSSTGAKFDVRPFAFLQELYSRRKAIKEESERTGIYNPMEIVLKLIINSVYGKLAQFVGSAGKVPKTANPYYAAATTAYCRRRLIEAALIDPHAIIFFATDGVVSFATFARAATRRTLPSARSRRWGKGYCRFRRLGILRGRWRYLRRLGDLFILENESRKRRVYIQETRLKAARRERG